MGARSVRRARAARPVRALVLLLVAIAVFGIAAPFGAPSVGGASPRGVSVPLASPQNSSSGGDPSASGSSVLCPSAGPVILGVEWNCVAVLDLTELSLILVSVGIVAYVFRGADQAELPGESEEVPVTADEWEAYRRARKLGTPYDQRKPPGGEEGS